MWSTKISTISLNKKIPKNNWIPTRDPPPNWRWTNLKISCIGEVSQRCPLPVSKWVLKNTLQTKPRTNSRSTKNLILPSKSMQTSFSSCLRLRFTQSIMLCLISMVTIPGTYQPSKKVPSSWVSVTQTSNKLVKMLISGYSAASKKIWALSASFRFSASNSWSKEAAMMTIEYNFRNTPHPIDH